MRPRALSVRLVVATVLGAGHLAFRGRHNGVRLACVAQASRSFDDELVRLFDFSHDGFCIAGFDGYLKRANPALPRILGHTWRVAGWAVDRERRPVQMPGLARS